MKKEIENKKDLVITSIEDKDQYVKINVKPLSEYIEKIKLTKVIKIWDILHIKNTGELGYCDLEKAIEEIVGIENDISPCQPLTKS